MTVQGVGTLVVPEVKVTAADRRREQRGDGSRTSAASWVARIALCLALLALNLAQIASDLPRSLLVHGAPAAGFALVLWSLLTAGQLKERSEVARLSADPHGLRVQRGGTVVVRPWADLSTARIGRDLLLLRWWGQGEELLPLRHLDEAQLVQLRRWISDAWRLPEVVPSGPRGLRDGPDGGGDVTRPAGVPTEPVLARGEGYEGVVEAAWTWSWSQAWREEVDLTWRGRRGLGVLAGSGVLGWVLAVLVGKPTDPVVIAAAAVVVIALGVVVSAIGARTRAGGIVKVEAGPVGVRECVARGWTEVAWADVERLELGRSSVAVVADDGVRVPLDVLGEQGADELARLARDAGVDVRGG
ncbi:MAG: hypothetical protein U0Q15_08735 [Kineosporiaceae bacterium]